MQVFSEAFLSDVVSVVFESLVVHDGAVILGANERAAQMFGYGTATAMAGLPYSNLVASTSRNLTDMRISTRAEGQYSVLCRRADGDELPAEVNVKETVWNGARARIVAFRYRGDSDASGEVATQRSLALEQTVKSLAATIEERDSFTAGHQGRVSELATQIATALGMSDREITTIRIAGNLHDIGKISVPSAILMKPEALTTEEYGLVKLHPETGFRIIHSVDFDGPVHDAILQHHERLDGSGYPRGIDDPIPEARILAVADVFDAITSSRPYRAGSSTAGAMDLMYGHESARLDGAALDTLSSLVLDQTGV